MSDSLQDLSALEQLHAATQPIADPYSLTETRFMEGYAEFHAMKVALRAQNDNADNQNNNNSPNPPNSPTSFRRPSFGITRPASRCPCGRTGWDAPSS